MRRALYTPAAEPTVAPGEADNPAFDLLDDAALIAEAQATDAFLNGVGFALMGIGLAMWIIGEMAGLLS